MLHGRGPREDAGILVVILQILLDGRDQLNARLREVYRDLPPFAMGRFGEQTSCEEEIV